MHACWIGSSQSVVFTWFNAQRDGDISILSREILAPIILKSIRIQGTSNNSSKTLEPVSRARRSVLFQLSKAGLLESDSILGAYSRQLAANLFAAPQRKSSHSNITLHVGMLLLRKNTNGFGSFAFLTCFSLAHTFYYSRIFLTVFMRTECCLRYNISVRGGYFHEDSLLLLRY